MSNADDLKWIMQVTLLGNKDAFDPLVRKYQSPIRRFFLNLTMGDSSLSDDLAQETFIKAYLQLKSFQGLSGFSTWLFRIAYNVFYDSVRTQKHQNETSLDEVDRWHSVDNDFSAEKSDLYDALRKLRQEERTAILLCYMEGMSHSQAAKVMKCPLGTLKSYVSAGKTKLAHHLQ
ncbi:sigma-70 family RNA polymerase sigma factor [Paludibacter sp.]|uniref:sigma-70 family RNA polymerase sigma factor n=1 Tax=Paludibacter sp. TaxID=1898105 RepID=UPI0013553E9F|nr:sigma-70 family RNA polymerase sigma factor [Paludibacter sp.]MTK52333.1 sigma-70 family RNA polymerase sigma factor [Paludibacter sp.]